MSQSQLKYCRHYRWAKYGWCTVLQQEVKPVAGKCFAFMTRWQRNDKEKEAGGFFQSKNIQCKIRHFEKSDQSLRNITLFLKQLPPIQFLLKYCLVFKSTFQ